MPEGDVLVRVSRRLDQALSGDEMLAAELRWPSVAGVELKGRTLLGHATYGKHLLARFSDGRTLHTHLRMEGRWQIERTTSPLRPIRSTDVRVILVGPRWTALGYRLGMVDVLATRDEKRLLAGLGPDILAPEPDHPRILDALHQRADRPIGPTLLDQTVTAGIGTIFMSESLFIAGISPWEPVGAIPDDRLEEILDIARKEMLRSIDLGHPRTTGDPRAGREGWVHARAGQPCRRCGGTVRVENTWTVHGHRRPVYFCPGCQVPRSGQPDSSSV